MNGPVGDQMSGKMTHEYSQEIPSTDDRRRPQLFQGYEEQRVGINADHDRTVAEVQKLYLFQDDRSVRQFFHNHRTIPLFLIMAAPRVRASFGAEAVISLKAPVDEGGSQTLYAVVMWRGKAKEALEALDKFDDAWWLNQRWRTAGYLTFTYELV